MGLGQAIKDKTIQDKTIQDKTIQDNTIQYKTRQDNTIQDKTIHQLNVSVLHNKFASCVDLCCVELIPSRGFSITGFKGFNVSTDIFLGKFAQRDNLSIISDPFSQFNFRCD